MTTSSHVLPLRRTKLSSQSELRLVVSLNCLRTNFSDEYQARDMPPKPVQHIAPRSLTNVNNEQNRETSGFSPCHNTTNSLHSGSNRRHHCLQSYKRKELCLSHIEHKVRHDGNAMTIRFIQHDSCLAQWRRSTEKVYIASYEHVNGRRRHVGYPVDTKTEERSTSFNRGGMGRFVVAREPDHGRWQH